jgi:PAS domain S-box-containing protein
MTGEKTILGKGRKLQGLKSDGSVFPMFLKVSKAKVEGKSVFTWILRDLSAEQQEHERMMAIVASAVDPIVEINQDGIINLVNAACCSTFQYKEKELLGQNVSILMPEPHSYLHDSYLKNYLTTGVKKVIGIGRKLRGSRRDGSTFSIYLTLSKAIINGAVVLTGIIRNLSAEEKQSEKIMAILQSAIDPVVQINEQGIIQFVNSACCKVFKYQQSEMVGAVLELGRYEVLGIGRKLRGRRSDGSTFSLRILGCVAVLEAHEEAISFSSISEVESGIFHIAGSKTTYFSRYYIDAKRKINVCRQVFYFYLHFVEPYSHRFFSSFTHLACLFITV